MNEKTRPNLKITPAKNGQPTASICRPDGRELFLHSRIDPGAEARFLIADIPIKEETLYVILGCGLGYHIKELLKKIPQSSRIVVIESSQNMLRNEMAEVCRRQGEKWFTDKRLSFAMFATPEAASFSLVKLYIDARLFSLEMFTHIPSASTDIAFYRQTAGSLQQDFPRQLASHLKTIDLTLENSLTNYWANLKHNLLCPSVEKFAGCWQKQPAIIVSAGPSLTSQLDELRQSQGKALIICVGTAAPILARNNIHPDFVISVDTVQANMENFRDWNTEETALLYYQRTWREIPAAFKGPKLWLAINGEVTNPITKSIGSMPFTKGGTVAFTALQFAQYIKADPILFVGQDFSFHRGKTHAAGSLYDNAPQESFDEDKLPDDYFFIPGVNSTMVPTNQVYYSYLVFMQEYIVNNPGVRYINTSPTGAKIAGTDHMPLKSAVQTFCNNKIDTSLLSFLHQTVSCTLSKQDFSQLCTLEQELEQFLCETDTDCSERTLSKFKKLRLYKILSPDYNEFFYAVKILESWFNQTNPLGLPTRLKMHVNQILQFIKEIRKG